MSPTAAITWIMAPAKPPPQPLQAPRRPATRPKVSTASRPLDVGRPDAALPAQTQSQQQPAAPQPITLPAPSAADAQSGPALPVDPFAAPAKPEAELKQRAIAGAFAADKQVRKESFTQRDRKLVNDETALAAAIGKAYVGGGAGPVGEIVQADGTRITKWRLPGGQIVCYYKQGNNGLDPSRDSGRVSVRRCL